MDKIISLLRLEGITKHSTAVSSARVACPDASPHPLLAVVGSSLATEVVKIWGEEKRERGYVVVKATLAPRLGYNLITRAKVEWLKMQDDIQDLKSFTPCPGTATEAALNPTGWIELGVVFQKAGTLTRTQIEKFFVVEQLWAGVELMLGDSMCQYAKIASRDRALPLRIEAMSAEERKQKDENEKKARERAEKKIAEEERELLDKIHKKPQEVTDQPK